MKRVKRLMDATFWRLMTHNGEAGQGLAEYGLILALIAIVCVGALGALGVGVRDSAGFVALPSTL
jgi:pilus assembly protein Flp/PilA